jgi:hypothetical protein
MAFEQNPYAVKITLIPDVSGVTAIAGQRVAAGIPLTAQVLTTGPAQNPLVFSAATSVSANGGASVTVTLPASVTAIANPVAVGQLANLEGFAPAVYNGQFYITAVGGSASAWTFTATLQGTATANPSTATGLVRLVQGSNESFSTSASVTASTQRPIGVLQNQPYAFFDANGNLEGVSEAEITVSGVCKMKAGGTVLPGNPITIDASGNATAYTFSTVVSAFAPITGQYVIGTALSAGVSGDIITVALACHNAVRGI